MIINEQHDLDKAKENVNILQKGLLSLSSAPKQSYNIARVLALCKSHWAATKTHKFLAAMNKIFIIIHSKYVPNSDWLKAHA